MIRPQTGVPSANLSRPVILSSSCGLIFGNTSSRYVATRPPPHRPATGLFVTATQGAFAPGRRVAPDQISAVSAAPRRAGGDTRRFAGSPTSISPRFVLVHAGTVTLALCAHSSAWIPQDKLEEVVEGGSRPFSPIHTSTPWTHSIPL
ncbi:hypothetical protein VTN96DRAFT_1647 [Rasamsonia emersonii]